MDIREEIQGFEWDDANWPKCGKHGVGRDEIEYVLKTTSFRIADPNPNEPRFRTAGRVPSSGRHVFVVFTYRQRGAETILIRPISARYMRQKEVERYERYFKNT